MRMKIIAVVALSLGLAACANSQTGAKQQVGTAVGGILGGLGAGGSGCYRHGNRHYFGRQHRARSGPRRSIVRPKPRPKPGSGSDPRPSNV